MFMRKLTAKQFITKAKNIFGDKYDYSKVIYVGNKADVIIICPVHGEFNQRPGNHLDGRDCKDCGILKRAATRVAKAKSVFIVKAQKVHADTFGYDGVDYKGNNHHVLIYCKIHEYYFSKSPSNHLKGQGCPKCALLSTADFHRSSTEEFIEKATAVHKGRYTYENVEYLRAIGPVMVTCSEHGDFPITPASHLGGSGCWDCGGSKPLTAEIFIGMAIAKHGDWYQYHKVIYKNSKTKVRIVCPDHGEFASQTPDAHLAGKGCNRCQNKAEGRLAIYLNEIHIVHREFKLDNRFFDFYLPEYNQLIERDGQQHYQETTLFDTTVAKQQARDAEKTNMAKQAGFKIARIPYWLDDDGVKVEIENILNNKPTYPDIPDLEQAIDQPKPKNNVVS